MKVARVTISDRASRGVYEDQGGPAIAMWVETLFAEEIVWEIRLIPDEEAEIAAVLTDLADGCDCALILTTGGTGPALRDVTPEATRRVLDKELPGFGEAMRMGSFQRVPTAILSRAVAGIRGRSLLVNLPGNPKAVGECLPLLAPAIAEALDHIRGERPSLRPAL